MKDSIPREREGAKRKTEKKCFYQNKGERNRNGVRRGHGGVRQLLQRARRHRRQGLREQPGKGQDQGEHSLGRGGQVKGLLQVSCYGEFLTDFSLLRRGIALLSTRIKAEECACIHSYQQRQWKKVVELREPRAYATAVSMTDGPMWIMGGMGVEGSVFFAFLAKMSDYYSMMILFNYEQTTELHRGSIHGYRNGNLQGQEVHGGDEEKHFRALCG